MSKREREAFEAAIKEATKKVSSDEKAAKELAKRVGFMNAKGKPSKLYESLCTQ